MKTLNHRLKNLSIAYSKSEEKSINIYKNKGFSLNNPVIFKQSNHKREKRSNISQWSRASRRRFRTLLLTKQFPQDFYMFGITLTIPGFPLATEQIKPLFDRWREYSTRLPFNFSAVWRLEIQKRQQIHWHLICGSDCHDPEIITKELKKIWLKSLKAIGECEQRYLGTHSQPELISEEKYIILKEKGILKNYEYWEKIREKHPIKKNGYDPIYDKACEVAIFPTQQYGNWLRYIHDHTSKAKQEQIANGMNVRHWGVINRKYLIEADPETIQLTDKEYYKVVRWFHRLAVPQVINPNSIFNKSLGKNTRSRGKAGTSNYFSDPDTIKRMIELSKES